MPIAVRVSALLVCLAAASAAWGGTTTVTLVPTGALEPLLGDEVEFGFVPDRRLPASEEFQVDIPVADAAGMSALLRVWPAVESPCGRPPAVDADLRQFHVLAMAPATGGAGPVLRATVPPLQVDVAFCMDVALTTSVADSTMEVVQGRLADAAHRALARPGSEEICSRDLGARALEAGFREGQASMGLLIADPEALAAQVYDTYAAKGGVGECTAYVVAADNINESRVGLEALARAVDEVAATLAPLPAPTSPDVKVDRGWVPAGSLLAEGTPDAELQKAKDQLVAYQDTRALDADIAAAWHDLLTRFEADPSTLANLQAEAAQALPRHAWVAVGDGSEWITVEAFLASPRAHDPTLVRDHLEARSALYPDSASRQILADWLAVLQTLEDAAASEASIRQTLAADETAQRTAAVNHRAKLGDAVVDDAVEAQIRTGVRRRAFSLRAGAGKTPKAGSWAAPEAGLAVAVPWQRGTAATWILPYVGINLSLVPVERVVPIRDQVAEEGREWQNRVGLTIGWTLSAPDLPGRTVEPSVATKYGLVALGVRATPYSRVNFGAVLYRVHDDDPVSDLKYLGLAPFVAFSLDADIIAMIKNLGN